MKKTLLIALIVGLAGVTNSQADTGIVPAPTKPVEKEATDPFAADTSEAQEKAVDSEVDDLPAESSKPVEISPEALDIELENDQKETTQFRPQGRPGSDMEARGPRGPQGNRNMGQRGNREGGFPGGRPAFRGQLGDQEDKKPEAQKGPNRNRPSMGRDSDKPQGPQRRGNFAQRFRGGERPSFQGNRFGMGMRRGQQENNSGNGRPEMMVRGVMMKIAQLEKEVRSLKQEVQRLKDQNGRNQKNGEGRRGSRAHGRDNDEKSSGRGSRGPSSRGERKGGNRGPRGGR